MYIAQNIHTCRYLTNKKKIEKRQTKVKNKTTNYLHPPKDNSFFQFHSKGFLSIRRFYYQNPIDYWHSIQIRRNPFEYVYVLDIICGEKKNCGIKKLLKKA